LAELEFIDQSIRALRPRLRQAGRHIIPGERFDQRVMEGIQKHKGRGDPRRLGRIEIGRSDRGVKGDNELSLRLAWRRGAHATKHDDYADNEPHDSVEQHTHTSSGPPVCPLLRVMTTKARSPSATSRGIVGRSRGPVKTMSRTCGPLVPGHMRWPQDKLSMRLQGNIDEGCTLASGRTDRPATVRLLLTLNLRVSGEDKLLHC